MDFCIRLDEQPLASRFECFQGTMIQGGDRGRDERWGGLAMRKREARDARLPLEPLM
jgi:hypothetical protein